MRVWVAGPHPVVEKLRLDLKTAGFVVAEDFACYLAILKPGAGLTVHGPKGRLTDLVAENVIDLRQTVTVGREGPDRSVTVVCGEKGDAEVASKAVLRAFEVLRLEMDAAPPPPTPKDRLFGINMAWASKLVWLWLLLASPLYAQSGGFSMVQTYQDGTFQGPAFAINCSTNTTCTLSGGIFTITSQGGGGTPGGADTQVQFNDSAAFGGDAGLTFNKTTNTLTTGTVRVGTSGPVGPGVTGADADDGLSFSGAGQAEFMVGGGLTGISLNESNDVIIFTYFGSNNAVLGAGLGFAIATAADSDPATASACSYGGTSYVCEGTADAHETTVAVVDPTADATFQFPARSAGTYTIMATGSCTDGVAYLDASGVVQCANTELQYDGTILRSDSLGLRDSSGSNTLTFTGGNHTANRTGTWVAGTDTTFALDSGRLSHGQALKVGPLADGWTTEAGSIAVELVAKNTSADVEIHAEGGLDTGYAGFGVRNNRLVDGGTSLTLAGGAWLAHGSAAASTTYGMSDADLVTFQNFGTNSTGLAIGTQTQDPLVLGVTSSTGSEVRYFFEDNCKSISDNSLAAFVQIAVPSGSLTGGRVDFVVWAVTGAAYQTRSGTMWYSVVNRAGTETCTVGNTAGTDLISITAVESGTISASFSCSTSPTNAVNLEITSDSSLTTPTMAICYSVYKGAGVGAITPQ